jgi:hypothetical protein
MKTTVTIRPEQARYVIGLKNAAQAAADTYTAALNAAVAGLLSGKSRIVSIADDGVVTFDVPEEERDGDPDA